MLVDNKLKWTEHTNQVSSKATKILNLLRRNLHHSSRAAKTRTYMALVRPILEYAAPVWSPHQKLQTTKLENIQKRATRWITAKWDKNTYTWDKAYTECMQELNWLPLNKRRDYLSCCQTYKIIHNLDCLSFNDFYTPNHRPTRSHTYALLCKHARVNCYRYSFFVNSCFLWNSLPSTVVCSSSFNTFKLALNTYLIPY